MFFGGLEFVAGKWLIVHGGHALAAKAVWAAHHPLPAVAHTAIHSAIHAFMSDPEIPIATKLAVSAVVHGGAAGAAGTTAASAPLPPLTLHTAAKVAVPVLSSMAGQQFRKSELYQNAKDALAELFDDKTSEPYHNAKDALAELFDDAKNRKESLPGWLEDWQPAILASIRQQSA
jgi:hypothetical protein